MTVSLVRWALLGMALAVNAQDIPLRIMPFGASITFGWGSAVGNGYREFLRDDLGDAGFTVEYVGSQKNGIMDNPENEGFPGKRIDELFADGFPTLEDVPDMMPNVYTINAGTNDCLQDHYVDTAGDRMKDLLNYLWDVTPDATVILSTLIYNADPDVEARGLKVNDQLRSVGQELADQGRSIVLAEMHGDDGPQPEDMNDTTHPVDKGHKKMAAIWADAIQKASDNGFIVDAP